MWSVSMGEVALQNKKVLLGTSRLQHKDGTSRSTEGHYGHSTRPLQATNHVVVVQKSFRGPWPTFAKKCLPLASSFAKLSRSPFSHVVKFGHQIGYQHVTCRFKPLCASFQRFGALSGVVLLNPNFWNDTAVTRPSRKKLILERHLANSKCLHWGPHLPPKIERTPSRYLLTGPPVLPHPHNSHLQLSKSALRSCCRTLIGVRCDVLLT